MTLYHRDDIPFRKNEIPNTYTDFRKTVENRSKVRPILLMSPLKPLTPIKDGKEGVIPTVEEFNVPECPNAGSTRPDDAKSAFPFAGGESAGLRRLKGYLWGTDCVAEYKETRNGLLGENYSTKFSPWLANGTLSPRMIYDELKKYEAERVSNQSTYWVVFELLWRDYFKFVCWRFGDKVFYPGGIKGQRYMI